MQKAQQLNSLKLAEKRKGLVVFDVEGVLLPKRRYIPFEATRQLGFSKFLRILFFGLLYEIGLLPLETALRRIFKCLEGHTSEELHRYYEKMPLLPGSQKTFEGLHKHGWKTALISSGLPNIVIQELAAKLKADYAFGLKLKMVNGKFSGEIEGEAIKKNGKATILKEILQKERMSPQNCFLVADDRNNLQMFPYARLRIGYNPDFMLSVRSDHVVTGSLCSILPIITETKSEKPEPTLSRNDILRSAIHTGGFAVPFICNYLFDRYLTAFLILIITLLFITSELTRITGKKFPVFTLITSRAAVKLEPYEFAITPIFYAFGIMLSLIVFSPQIAYASIATLTLGDSSASIFGKKYGKTRFPFNKAKSVEGSVFGVIIAFLGATLFIDPVRAFIGAITGMIVESLPTPISDNLAVPMVTGLALSLASL
jgi:phosphoserine phosphatase/dolichol kinase